MKVKSANLSIIGKGVLIGIGLAALYWVLDSAMHAFLFHEGTFIKRLFLLVEPHIIWERFLVVGLLVIFSVFAQFIINKRKRAEEEQAHLRQRLEALWKIARMVDADYQTLCDHVLDELVSLTQSRFAFFGFLNDDESVMTLYSWSREVYKECQIQDKPIKYPIAKAGLWGDAVRQRRTLIINDYQADHPSKKGLPVGHVPLTRILAVPTFSRGRIGMLAVVANKETEYTEEDAEQIRTFVANAQIVLERRQDEEALRQSQQNYEALVGSVDGIVWEADARTLQFSFVSKQAERLLGYPVERWLTESTFWKDHIHPDDRERAISFYANATAEKRTHEFEYRMIAADGRTVWLRDIVSVVVENGQPVKLRGIMVDITERKKAEEELARLASFPELNPHSIVEMDIAGVVTYLNPAAREQFPDLLTAGPEHPILKDLISAVTTLQSQGKKYLVRQTEVGNRVYEQHISYIPESKRIRSYIEDISERKKMEEQLIITDRLASVGELTSGIAHELNNPLTGIIGFSELLLSKDVPEDIKEDLRVINKEAQRTAGIVKNLLTFARKHPPAKEPVNINKIIQEVLKLRAYEQKVHNIEVNTQFDPDLPEITADGFQLQQVFLNIIINAEYFMIEAHGRGTLTITTERVDDIVRASFADDGPGIAEENLEHLFDPFFTTKEVGKGTGLGLSICHGIITEHGGRIYAESKLGKGATFVIELPVLVGKK